MGWRLWGPGAPGTDLPLRYYVLPGEPLYLASAFAVLPPSAERYVHVPITVLLIGAVVAFAAIVGGPRLGVATGLVAALQPFMIVHGPVWDDTFLAASMEWVALAAWAAILHRNAKRGAGAGLTTSAAAGLTTIAALSLGVAAVTRGDVLLFAVLLAVPAARRDLHAVRRPIAWALVVVAVAVGAWGLRNRAATGQFEIGSSHDGITLWESNGPFTAEAIAHGQVMMLSLDSARMEPYWSDTRPMDEAAANHYFSRRAVEFVLTHPLNELRLVILKSFYTITSIRPELPLGSPRNLIGILSNLVTFALAIVGVRAHRASRAQLTQSASPAARLLLPLVITTVALIAIGPIGMRYRIALDGVLWMCAGAGALHVVGALYSRLHSSSSAPECAS